jgi:hypothetical protein
MHKQLCADGNWNVFIFQPSFPSSRSPLTVDHVNSARAIGRSGHFDASRLCRQGRFGYVGWAYFVGRAFHCFLSSAPCALRDPRLLPCNMIGTVPVHFPDELGHMVGTGFGFHERADIDHRRERRPDRLGRLNSSASFWRTNVWPMFTALDLTNDDQVACYDDGVGTSSFKPLALLGGAFGIGLRGRSSSRGKTSLSRLSP